MKIDTSFYERCISTLEKAHGLLLQANPAEIDYDMYRSACVKEAINQQDHAAEE